MGHEGAVKRDEPQTLDLTLREQHPIEGIPGHGLWFDGSERVTFVDHDDLHAQSLEKLGQSAEADRELEFAQPPLDRDFPKARRA